MYELQEQIEALLEQKARGSGVNASFLCPFHHERVPSFSIHLDEGLWYCFGCGRKGNLEQLYSQLGEELTEDERLTLLVKSVYREPEPTHNFAALANQYVRRIERREGQDAWHSFADPRGITESARIHFGIGYSLERTALAFPYWDDSGRVTAIKYRHIDGSKSSKNGGKRSLYGVGDIIGKNAVIICEGESDTLSTWSRVPSTLGVCGSPGASVSDKTWANWGLDFLFAHRIYVAFDADAAGDKGAETAMRVLGDRTVRLRPTRGKDLTEHYMNGGLLEELDGMAEEDLQPELPSERG